MLAARGRSASCARGRSRPRLALQADALETAEGRGQRLRDLLGAQHHRPHRDRRAATGTRARRDAEHAVALVEGLERRGSPRWRGPGWRVIQRRLGERPQGAAALIDAAPAELGRAVRRGDWRAPSSPTGAATPRGRSSSASSGAAERLGLPWATALAERARAAVLLADGRRRRGGEARAGVSRAASARRARSTRRARRCSPAARWRPRATARRRSPLLRAAEHTFAANGIEHDRDLARRELRRLEARTEPRGPTAAATAGSPRSPPASARSPAW